MPDLRPDPETADSGDYTVVIGLECHVQLATATKLFCPCPVNPAAHANTAVCPICLGHPGTLPMLNDRAVELATVAAFALGCTIHPTSVFSRKHYFYPDLPKGYQITQHQHPLATGGAIHANGHRIGLQRLHLEEDSGKLVYSSAGTTFDGNRAGVPLVEIVSEPTLRTPGNAEAYLRVLHRVLVESGVCTGDLERGHFRCDANISLHREGEPWGNRVELKNLNSFRFVAAALRHEIRRQREILERGGTVLSETRSWSGTETVSLRRKEDATDYRYLDEPDLPPLHLSPENLAVARGILAGVPLDLYLANLDQAKARHWTDAYGLAANDVQILVNRPEAAAFLAACVAGGGPPKPMAAWVIGELLQFDGFGALEPVQLVQLQHWLVEGKINRDAMKTAIGVLHANGGDPAEVVERLGLAMVVDDALLRQLVDEALTRHPEERGRYLQGNSRMFGFFMGKIMAASQRRASPATVERLLREALGAVAG